MLIPIFCAKETALSTIIWDGEKIGLWSGLSMNLHQEFVYGDDVTTQNDGTYLPINTALALPRLGGHDHDTSIILTQKINDQATLSLGKFNMLDAAARTPILSGGGLNSFQNIGFAAPINPPYLLGASLSLRLERVSFNLIVYDPRNAQDSYLIKLKSLSLLLTFDLY